MRRLVLLVSAIVLVDTIFFAALAPLLPTYEEEFGLSKQAAGLLTAIYAAGGLAGAIPGGLLASRLGVNDDARNVGFAAGSTVQGGAIEFGKQPPGGPGPGVQGWTADIQAGGECPA